MTSPYDFHAPGWLVAVIWLLALGLLALAVLWYRPGPPDERRFGPRGAFAAALDDPTARSIATIALGGGLMFIVAHVLVALFVVPVFSNMFASVELSLPEPTRTLIALSRARLLAPAFIALDATVLLLWYRIGRPTWVQLFLVVGTIFVLIAGATATTLYLPIHDMINAVQ